MPSAFSVAAAFLGLLALSTTVTAYTGDGTAYSGDYEKDATGRNACGFDKLSSYFEKYYAALPVDGFKDSYCGRCIKARGLEPGAPGVWVKVKVVDQCASCSRGDVDFSTRALKEITGFSWDRKRIEWEWVSCDEDVSTMSTDAEADAGASSGGKKRRRESTDSAPVPAPAPAATPVTTVAESASVPALEFATPAPAPSTTDSAPATTLVTGASVPMPAPATSDSTTAPSSATGISAPPPATTSKDGAEAPTPSAAQTRNNRRILRA